MKAIGAEARSILRSSVFAVPVVSALIALVSIWVPAGRTSRIDPLDALRNE